MFKRLAQALCKRKPIVEQNPVITALEQSAKRVWDESPNMVLDISEPVTSFLKCFLNNPRRFKLVCLGSPYRGASLSAGKDYKFTDTKTKEQWSVSHRPMYNTTVHIDNVPWMTRDERELINDVIAKYYADRSEKLDIIRKGKNKAKLRKERDRLTAIYKGDK